MGKKNRNNQKTGIIVLVSFIICSFPLHSRAEDPLSKEERAWVASHGEIRIGAFNDYPPFGFVDATGQAQGMSIDFWNLIASKLNFKVKFHPVHFDKQIEGLKSGEFDSLAGIFPLEERRKSFDFTGQYTLIATSIYVQLKYGKLKDLNDLKGSRVGVVKDDSGQYIAQNAKLNPTVFSSYEEVLSALAKGDLDAAIMDELVVNYYVTKHDLTDKITKLGEPVDEGEMTLPVAKGNTILLGILNKGISSVSTGEWQGIKRKWVGKEP